MSMSSKLLFSKRGPLYLTTDRRKRTRCVTETYICVPVDCRAMMIKGMVFRYTCTRGFIPKKIQ